MNELTYLIKVWTICRQLDKGDPIRQALKVTEELGELAGAIVRNNEHETKDAIGDIFVTLVVLCEQKGWSIEKCVQQAYDEIKDRNGVMQNGVYIKAEDLESGY